MANTRNDDMGRSGNKRPAPGSSQGNQGNPAGGTMQGRKQGRDPVNMDREMNRDGEIGQGSSGTEQGRQGQPGTTGSTKKGTDE